MPVLDSYLFFNGNCAEAIRFYEQTLGAKLEASMTYAEAPESHPCPAGAEDRVMHSSLLVGDRRLMASDVPPGYPSQGMHGFGLSLTYPTVDEARRVFDALCAGGNVSMPMAKTFWADAFGMCSDRFGTPWLVSGGAHG